MDGRTSGKNQDLLGPGPQLKEGGRIVLTMCSAQVTISCSNPSLLSVPEPEVTKPKELGSIRWPQSRVRRGWPLVAVCGARSPSPCAG